MKMQGEEIIAAPRQVVWDALNDPQVLKQCITGCEEIKKKSPTEFEAKVTAKVGPVKASFVGNVKMSKLNPPRSYVISGEGKGGIAGFAKGGATVQLSDTADGSTKLSYDVDAQVGGKLAQIGSRLIDSTAKKMASDFFTKFNKLVSDRAKEDEIEKKSAPAAKKAAAKKAATKSATSKTPAKTTAASKTTVASKSAAKPAVKSEKTKPAASKATASKPGKAAAEPAKAAKKVASKSVASKSVASKSVASKPAAKTASKPAAKAAKKEPTTPRQGASSVPAGGSAPSLAPVTNQAAPVVPEAVAASPVQKTSEQVKTPADNIPPQAKAMSSVWLFAVLAAVAALIVVWAFG